MDFVYIGNLVNTHGIKGEVRITSDFKYKKQIFVAGFKLYIGKNKEELTIKTYRVHKNYDMVTFEGINNINDCLAYKGENVYINRSDLKECNYVNEDLINMEVYDNDTKVGIVREIVANKIYDILVVVNMNQKFLIPNIDEFVNKIDLDNKKIFINNIKGLINEN